MMKLGHFFEMAIKSFNGEWFYLSYLKNEKYLSMVGDIFTLFSAFPLNDNSVSYDDIFYTEYKIKDLKDVTRAKIFIKYRGNEYEAMNVRKGFDSVVLKARKGLEKEDIEERGFICNRIDLYTHETTKKISKEEIEDIRIEETSVYDEFLEKYGNNE